MSRNFIHWMQSCSATQAPVMAAVRVPPSACSTSQSIEIWRSPSWVISTMARSARPIRRWISCVRPDAWPTVTSRRVRSEVARGSMPYSAVTQPRPWPLSQGGTRSSRLAVHRTWVSPNLMRQEPFGVLGDRALDGDAAKLVRLAFGGAHEGYAEGFPWVGLGVRLGKFRPNLRKAPPGFNQNR